MSTSTVSWMNKENPLESQMHDQVIGGSATAVIVMPFAQIIFVFTSIFTHQPLGLTLGITFGSFLAIPGLGALGGYAVFKVREHMDKVPSPKGTDMLYTDL